MANYVEDVLLSNTTTTGATAIAASGLLTPLTGQFVAIQSISGGTVYTSDAATDAQGKWLISPSGPGGAPATGVPAGIYKQAWGATAAVASSNLTGGINVVRADMAVGADPTIATAQLGVAQTWTAIQTFNPDLVLGARLVMTPPASKIVSGATSLSLRNAADTVDNLFITNAGNVGISTTNPQALLQIGTGVATTGAGTLLSLGSQSLNELTPRLTLYDDGVNTSYVTYGVDAATRFKATSSFLWQTVPTGVNRFQAGTTLMQLGVAGTLGVGGAPTAGLAAGSLDLTLANATLRLTDGTQPKYLRCQSGALQVLDKNITLSLLTLTDFGLLNIPQAAATTTGLQINNASTIRSGNGLPANTMGIDGDYYFRNDGLTGGTHIYFRTAGAYLGIA